MSLWDLSEESREGLLDNQRKGLFCLNYSTKEMFFTKSIETLFFMIKYLHFRDEEGFSRWMEGDEIEVKSDGKFEYYDRTWEFIAPTQI